MGKIITSVFENCLFNISLDKNSETVFNPNNKVVNFIKNKISEGYDLCVLCLSNKNNINDLDIDVILKQYSIEYKNLIWLNGESKTNLIVEKIKPDIYVDYHAEFCAALDLLGINTYLFLENENIDNKCATGIKTL